jgi:hypothetical protein
MDTRRQSVPNKMNSSVKHVETSFPYRQHLQWRQIPLQLDFYAILLSLATTEL